MKIKTIFFGWWITAACFLISLYVGGVAFFGLTAFFEPMIEEFGWSYTQVSLAASLRGLEMGIFAPLVGFLVDRFGCRKLIFFGALTVGCGLLLLSQTRTLGMFYGAYLLLAFGAGGCTSVVLMVIVANWFKKNIGKAMGIMTSGYGASGLLIPLIVRLIDAYNWRTAMIIMGLGMWLVGIPVAAFLRNRPEDCGYQPDGLATLPVPGEPETDPPVIETVVTFKEVIRNHSFWHIILIDVIRMLVATTLVLHVMPYLGEIGFERTTAGIVAGAIPLLSIIGRFGFGWFADVFEKRRVMTAAYVLMAIGMLLFCFVRIHWIVLLFLPIFSVGFGGSMVIRGTILREYYGTHALGKMLGIVLGAASIGGIIGPTLAGWAYDTTGSYRLVWPACFLVMTASIFFSLNIRPIHNRN